jgi:hypothetical protein
LPAYNIFCRGLLKSTAAATAFTVFKQASAQVVPGQPGGRSDNASRETHHRAVVGRRFIQHGQPLRQPVCAASSGQRLGATLQNVEIFAVGKNAAALSPGRLADDADFGEAIEGFADSRN